jgi:hypothetical protein
MSLSPTEQHLLREILSHVHRQKRFPKRTSFRMRHEKDRDALETLVKNKYLNGATGYYILTLKGLRACQSKEAKTEIELCNLVLDRLKLIYYEDAIHERLTYGTQVRKTVNELRPHISNDPETYKYYTNTELAITLTFLAMELSRDAAEFKYEKPHYLVSEIVFFEGIRDTEAIPTTFENETPKKTETPASSANPEKIGTISPQPQTSPSQVVNNYNTFNNYGQSTGVVLGQGAQTIQGNITQEQHFDQPTSTASEPSNNPAVPKRNTTETTGKGVSKNKAEDKKGDG